jgi:uncharacterized Zn-binding protein involved in type VI secretion
MISGTPDTEIDGAKVCRLNDMATCPRHKGVFPIVAGCDDTIIIDGQPVALDGAALACGCRVMAGSQNLVFVDSRSEGGASSYLSAFSRSLIRGTGVDSPMFDDLFRVELEDGSPASGYRYEVRRKDGSVMEGLTDSQGMIPLQWSDVEESIEIRLLENDAGGRNGG